MAPPLCKAGAIVAVIGYDLAMKCSLEEMIQEIIRALDFLDKWCQNNRTSGFTLAGHSAGAHLASMALICSTPKATLKSLFLLSGVFDLTPIVGTYIDKGGPLK